MNSTRRRNWVLLLADAGSPHVLNQVSGLQEQELEVVVVSARAAPEDFPAEIVRPSRWLPKVPAFLWIAWCARRLGRQGALAVHAHYLSSYGVAGALSGVRRYAPFVITVWGTDIAVSPARSRFHRVLARWALRCAHLVIATSNDLAARTQAHLGGEKRVVVQPFGVDLSTFAPSALAETRHPDHVHVLATRNLRPNYGLEVLIEALPQVSAHSRLSVTIAGDGPDRVRLEDLAARGKHAVSFAGSVRYSQIPALLHSSQIAVLPSTGYEALGVAAVEAMACGVPVVASRIGGLAEVVDHGRTGYLVEPGSPTELAAALSRLADDPALRTKLGREARHVTEIRYDRVRLAGELRQEYETLQQTHEQPEERFVDAAIGWDIGNWRRALPYWLAQTRLDLRTGLAVECGAGANGGLSLWLDRVSNFRIVASSDQEPSAAREVHRSLGVTPRMHYCGIDLKSIGLRTESVDLILTKSVLGSVARGGNQPDLRRAVAEVRRVLRPGGEYWFAENMRGTWLHRTGRAIGGAAAHGWYYPAVDELMTLFGDFRSLDYTLFGVSACLGRTERQRAALAWLDRMVLEPACPRPWRYLVAGVARR